MLKLNFFSSSANEQYINDIEERCLNAENELFKLRKEMECVMQEALKVPDGFQLSRYMDMYMYTVRTFIYMYMYMYASYLQLQNTMYMYLHYLWSHNYDNHMELVHVFSLFVP